MLEVPTDSLTISLDVLACSSCGKSPKARCKCNAGFGYRRASEAAKLGLDANPDASNREIARKTGVSHTTVNRTKSGGTNVPVGRTSVREQVIEVYRSNRGGLTVDEVRQELPKAHPQTVNSAVNTLAKAGNLYDSGKRAKTRSEGGRPAIIYKYRAKPPPDPTETMTDAEFSNYAEQQHDANPKNHYAAFIIRVEQAIEWAKLNYPYDMCKVTAEAVAMARRAAAIWGKLADDMETRRTK